MNRTLIFITLFLILCIYTCYSNNKDNIETFAVDAATKEAIKKEVNDIYIADVDSIRNLSEVANKLQSSGLILPGDGSVRGKLTVDGDATLKSKLNVTGETTINNLNVNGNSNLKAVAINGAGGALQLYGTGPTSHTYMEFYPDKADRRAYFGFPGDNSKELQMINQYTDGIIKLGVKNKGDALVIDKDGNTTINGNLNINGNFPIVNVAFKRGLVENKDINVCNTLTTLSTCNYTPKLTNSSIYISCDCSYLIDANGNNDDDLVSYIYINDTEVFGKNQHSKNVSGGGTRSPTMFPISFLYNNTNKAALKIEIKAKRTWGGDCFTIYNNGFLINIIEYNAIIL